jgi:hypothetical protein
MPRFRVSVVGFGLGWTPCWDAFKEAACTDPTAAFQDLLKRYLPCPTTGDSAPFWRRLLPLFRTHYF